MIVFDFHGCLSLSSKDIKTYNIKNILNKEDWYESMVKLKVDPYFLMPTLDDVVKFVDNIKYKRNDIIFAIASMLEDEDFMYDMMKYCFDCKGKISPFTKESICGTRFDKKEMKIPHIQEILKRLNLKIDNSNIILIDDTEKIVSFMRNKGIFSILVKKYFILEEWNHEVNKRNEQTK